MWESLQSFSAFGGLKPAWGSEQNLLIVLEDPKPKTMKTMVHPAILNDDKPKSKVAPYFRWRKAVEGLDKASFGCSAICFGSLTTRTAELRASRAPEHGLIEVKRVCRPSIPGEQ